MRMVQRFGLKPNWNTVAIVLLLILPFNIFLFPARHNYVASITGREDVIIDVWFAYTPQRVYEVLPLYSQQGRMLYAVTELTMDVLYPVLYSTLLWLLMNISLSSLLSASSLQKLMKLPGFLFIMDILENSGISALLLSYPLRLDWLAWMTCFFSTLKFIFGILGIGIVVIAGLALAWKSIKGWAKT